MSKIQIDIKNIKHYVGREIGLSKWVEITQSRVNKFAEATGDFLWVHVDTERAKTELPSGMTQVHNYLLLSMVPQLFEQIVGFTGLRYGQNKGATDLNFTGSIPVGSRIRIRLRLLKLEYHDQNGQTAIFQTIMERENSEQVVLSINLQILLHQAVDRLKSVSRLQSILSNQHQPAALRL